MGERKRCWIKGMRCWIKRRGWGWVRRGRKWRGMKRCPPPSLHLSFHPPLLPRHTHISARATLFNKCTLIPSQWHCCWRIHAAYMDMQLTCTRVVGVVQCRHRLCRLLIVHKWIIAYINDVLHYKCIYLQYFRHAHGGQNKCGHQNR